MTKERLVPILESRAYRQHLQRQQALSVAERVEELPGLLEDLKRRRSVPGQRRRRLNGELPSDLSHERRLRLLHLRADVRWQTPLWRALKHTYDEEQLRLVDAVERACRPMPNRAAGRPQGAKTQQDSPLSDADLAHARTLAEAIRPLVKAAKKRCAGGRSPASKLREVASIVAPRPSYDTLTTNCVTSDAHGYRQMPRPPEEIVRWVIAQHLGVGLTRAKQIIKRSRRG